MSAASLIVIWLCSKPCVLRSKCKAWVLYLFMGFLCRGRWQFECWCDDRMSDQERTGGLSLWNLTNTSFLSLMKDVESTLNHSDEQVKLTLCDFSFACLFFFFSLGTDYHSVKYWLNVLIWGELFIRLFFFPCGHWDHLQGQEERISLLRNLI